MYKDKKQIPHYDSNMSCWIVEVDGRIEEGDLTYIASEFVKGGMIFPFYVAGEKSHEHSFEDVIKNVLIHPEQFTVEGFEEYYSTQELKFLEQIRAKVLELVGGKDMM